MSFGKAVSLQIFPVLIFCVCTCIAEDCHLLRGREPKEMEIRNEAD